MFNKFNKILIALSLVFMLSNCKTFSGSNTEESSEEEVQQEDFSMDEQPQDQQNFEVLEGEQAANELNEQIQKDIEEVEVPDRVLFAVNSSDLAQEAKDTLKTQSEWLLNDTSIDVMIEGHCDDRGPREYNIALGEKRAAATKNYLISLGVDASRINTVSYGKEKPAFVGSGEEVWSKNRRAVTVLK